MAPSCHILGAEGAALYAALHADCFEEPWTEPAFRDLLVSPSVTGWVIAKDEGEPCGLLLVQRAAQQAEILTIGIQPASRGQGLAGQLLRQALESLSQDAVTELFLDVAEDNIAARALYRAAGFEEFGRRPRYYKRGDTRIDALNLRRRHVNL